QSGGGGGESWGVGCEGGGRMGGPFLGKPHPGGSGSARRYYSFWSFSLFRRLLDRRQAAVGDLGTRESFVWGEVGRVRYEWGRERPHPPVETHPKLNHFGARTRAPCLTSSSRLLDPHAMT